jgi:hypothetical protein
MIIAFGGAIAIWLGLLIRKKRKMNKPVLELYDVGQVHYLKSGEIDPERSAGIFDFSITKGGWFGNHITLFGLWDYGTEKIFMLKDGTRVYDVSHNDYRKINGVNGIVVVRNPNDPKFAIPVSKFFISRESKTAMAEIAPLDLRNAAVMAVEQVDNEMKTKWEKIMPILAIAFLGLVLIFSILLIAQYGKHNVDVTAETLRYATDKLMQNCGSATAGVSP